MYIENRYVLRQIFIKRWGCLCLICASEPRLWSTPGYLPMLPYLYLQCVGLAFWNIFERANRCFCGVCFLVTVRVFTCGEAVNVWGYFQLRFWLHMSTLRSFCDVFVSYARVGISILVLCYFGVHNAFELLTVLFNSWSREMLAMLLSSRVSRYCHHV